MRKNPDKDMSLLYLDDLKKEILEKEIMPQAIGKPVCVEIDSEIKPSLDEVTKKVLESIHDYTNKAGIGVLAYTLKELNRNTLGFSLGEFVPIHMNWSKFELESDPSLCSVKYFVPCQFYKLYTLKE